MLLWYIDECGITEEERLLVVGGYCIDDSIYLDSKTKFQELKQKYLPHPDRKIDMKKLIQGKDWLRNMSLDQRREFLMAFYNLIDTMDLRVCISMVDRDASAKIRNKLQFSYELLFERIELNTLDISNIKGKHQLAIIFSDTMMNYREVMSWFKKFYEVGTGYVTNNHLIERVIPLQMSQSELLQISDLIIGTYTYRKKAINQQKSVMWAKDALDYGYNIILKKAPSVASQDEKKKFSSIKEYAVN